jgi:uncharacterized delta-60 repeat protein
MKRLMASRTGGHPGSRGPLVDGAVVWRRQAVAVSRERRHVRARGPGEGAGRRQRFGGALTRPMAVITIIGFALGWAGTASASGDLDRRFGGDGIVRTDVGQEGLAYSLVEQPDGRLVAAGSAFDQTGDAFAAARFTGSGHLDPTFGRHGLAWVPFDSSAGARDAVLDASGRIVVGGYADVGISEFALIRLLDDGQVDPTFGDEGIVLTLIEGWHASISALSIAPDQTIVAVGRNYPVGQYDLALAHYLADGSLDPSFGGDGIVVIDLSSGGDDMGLAVDLQDDGKVVVGGIDGGIGSLVRLNADGSLDQGFGDQGVVDSPLPVVDVHVLPDGGILALRADFTLTRYTSTGIPDPSFGDAGTVTVAFSEPAASYALDVQADGAIVVAGSIGADFSAQSIAVARLDPRGRLDRSFGTGGRAVANVTGSSVGQDVVAQDHRIVVAGHTILDGRGSEFILAAFVA